MKRLRLGRNLAVIAGLGAVVAAGVAVAVAAVAPKDDGKVHACVKKSNGDVRIVGRSATCKPSERALVWGTTGPEGAAGPAGPAGPIGPKGDPGAVAAVSSGPPTCTGEVDTLGAVDTYAAIDGIPGESLNDRHNREVDVSSVKFCVDTAPATGATTTPKVGVSDVTITKHLDAASVPLLKAALNAQHIPTVKIDLDKPGFPPVNVQQLVLNDVVVTSVRSVSKGQVPTETVAFRFAKIAVTYRRQNNDGSTTPITMTYDVASGATT